MKQLSTQHLVFANIPRSGRWPAAGEANSLKFREAGIRIRNDAVTGTDVSGISFRGAHMLGWKLSRKPADSTCLVDTVEVTRGLLERVADCVEFGKQLSNASSRRGSVTE